MASPGDLSGPAGATPEMFAAGELTADDFERLSSAFRPSWEPDVAVFGGAASLSLSDVRSLGGAEVRADVRGTIVSARLANGTHPPAKATVASDPVESVIVQGRVETTAIPVPSVPTPPRPVPVAIDFPAPAGAAATGPRFVPSAPRPVAPTLPGTGPGARSLSIDLEDSPFARRSNRPLWIGLGVAAATLVGVAAWGMSGTGTPTGGPVTSGAAMTLAPVATKASESSEPPAATPPSAPAVTLSAPVAAPSPAPSAAPVPSPARAPGVQPSAKAAAAATSKAIPTKPKAAPPPPIVRDVPF